MPRYFNIACAEPEPQTPRFIRHDVEWGSAMGTHLAPVRRDSTDELHPRIYAALIGLTIWLVLSVWVLFSRGSYVGLSDSIITLFFAVLVGLPVMLWLSWRHNAEPQDQNREAAPFGEWAAKSFTTWTGRISGREASIQILLPIAAVAIGMTIFGLVFVLVVPNS